MDLKSGFGERLAHLILEYGGHGHGSLKAFSVKLEVPFNTLHKWTKRGSMPSAEQLVNFREKLGININWLLTGQGSKYLPSAPAPAGEQPEQLKKGFYWGDVEVALPAVAERLKKIRGKLTVQQAAEASGVPAWHIKIFEAGKEPPTAQYLYWAGGYGNINTTWIMTGENPQDASLAAEGRPQYGQPISMEERELLAFYRDATKEGQAATMAVLKIYQPKGN